jgi:ceramide glucosyltransferase
MQPAYARRKLTVLAWLLAGAYGLDRLLKLVAVQHFLRQPPPPAPPEWPSVALLQPVTRGASDLPRALACRAALRYAGRLQHILICDAGDTPTLALCQAWCSANLHLEIQIIALPAADGNVIATKIEKLHAGLPYADGAVLAFVDDDIALRPDAVERLVRHLQEPQAGSAFGLAAYTDWSNAPSSLLSAFVNANALLTYLPLTYLTEPFTITGHFYALHRDVFAAIGGLGGMAGRFDDDHELARRVQQHGLTNVQTPVIYDVDNHLSTLYDYANQMQRWFVIPKQTMAPFLTPRQQAVSLLGSLGNLIPPLLGLLVLLRKVPLAPLLGCLALFSAVYAWCERCWIGRSTPRRRWPLVWLSALVAPVQAIAGLLGGDTFKWRERRIRLHKGGRFEVRE